MDSDNAPGANPPKIGVWSIADWTAQVLERPHRPTPVGATLAQYIGALHEEMGLRTAGVDALITELSSGDAAIIRLAHQPNLFPYEQLVAQSVYLADAATVLRNAGRSIIPIVLVVDFDESHDDRIKGANALDPTASAQIRRFKVKTRKSVPTFLVDPPDKTHRAALTDQLAAFARVYKCKPDHLLEHSGVQRVPRSLADHNLFSWMQLTIGIWDLPLLFVRLSDIAPMFEMQRLALVDQMAAVTGRDRTSYLWHICRDCQRRVVLDSICCGKTNHHDWSLPRVVVDDLSDYALYGVSGGTAYYRARVHLEPAFEIGMQLDLDLPPESCWRLAPAVFESRPNFLLAKHAHAQNLLIKGHNSLLEHILDAERAAGFLRDIRMGLDEHLI